jgi:hypothetical protein
MTVLGVNIETTNEIVDSREGEIRETPCQIDNGPAIAAIRWESFSS